MDEYRAEIARNQPVDPKTLVKQQFVMSKSEALKRKETARNASVTLFVLYNSDQQGGHSGLPDLKFCRPPAHKLLSAED